MLSMAASSSAISDQAAVAKSITQDNSNSTVHLQINSAPIIITNHQTTNSELPIYNCTNCDIKFDSENSLRVHLQVSPYT